MFSSPKKNWFPLWQFLNQPIFDPSAKTVLSPRRYWRLHQIQLLERCLLKACTSKDSRCD